MRITDGHAHPVGFLVWFIRVSHINLSFILSKIPITSDTFCFLIEVVGGGRFDFIAEYDP